jgi:hypothetical protein
MGHQSRGTADGLESAEMGYVPDLCYKRLSNTGPASDWQ